MTSNALPQRPLNVAVVGATGAVGEVLLRLLRERELPIGRLLPLASARSEGSRVRFGDAELAVERARPEAFEGIDLVFFAATGELSRALAPEAVARGAVVIDKSATWRMNDAVPLVVPEINAEALRGHGGIIACPNCTTIGMVMALEPLRRAAGVRSLVVTTLQAASGAGAPGLVELRQQMRDVLDGEEPRPEAFAAPIADNVIPLCGSFVADDYTDEEHKLVDETRKIFGLPELSVSATCVRVPVGVGHSTSVLVETERPLGVAEARQAIEAFPGVTLVDAPARNEVPTPRACAGGDEILVGRVRHDPGSGRLWLFQCGDNLRKGAALNAIQIAEALTGR